MTIAQGVSCTIFAASCPALRPASSAIVRKNESQVTSFSRRNNEILPRLLKLDFGDHDLASTSKIHRHVRQRQEPTERYFPSNLSVRSCSLLIKPSAPPEAMIDANSSGRVARSLIVPLSYTSITCAPRTK